MSRRAQYFNARILQEMGIPPLESGLDGRGVAIAFIDYGFDILHPCFRTANGRTRFKCIVDQNTGRELDESVINQLIEECEQAGSRSVADTQYDPHANYFGRSGVEAGAHGTSIASIAAGSPVAGFRGVAPAADLIGIQLALPDHHWKEEDELGRPTWRSWQPASEPVWRGWRSYDEASAIVDALDHVYDIACRHRAKALVVNLSIGAYAGAHDGRSTVERKITELARRGANGSGLPCTVVVSAGNAGLEEGHYCGYAEPGRPFSFEWRMSREDTTQNKLEIWYCSAQPLEITVAPAGSDQQLRITPGATHPIIWCGTRVGIADHVPQVRPPLSRARLMLHPPYVPDHLWDRETGELLLNIRCTAVEDTAFVHAWLERDDGLENRSTLYPSDASCSLSCLATAEGAVVVGAYVLDGPSIHPFPPSSLGPHPWTGEHTAPLLCAPGHRIWGVRSKSLGFSEISGTSAATALTSGVIALLYQRLSEDGASPMVSPTELLIEHCYQGKWSPRFGFGAVDIRQLIGEVAA